MRGYFAIGVEGISKAMNLGNLLRSAHAFGASFFFTINAHAKLSDAASDTSDASGHLPVYQFRSVDDLRLPQGCQLIGVEITDDALQLPSFRHPLRAAYVLGGERSSLSPQLIARSAHVVRIPTRFSLNLGVAGALVMYDRLINLGQFAERPVRAGGPTEVPPPHRWGAPIVRRKRAAK